MFKKGIKKFYKVGSCEKYLDNEKIFPYLIWLFTARHTILSNRRRFFFSYVKDFGITNILKFKEIN